MPLNTKLHSEKVHAPDVFETLRRVKNRVSIPSAIPAPPSNVLSTLAHALNRYGTVSQSESYLHNGYRRYSIRFTRAGELSALLPKVDAADVEFAFDEIRMAWEVKGSVFGVKVNVSLAPRPFFRMLSNNAHQENAAELSFFHWAEKYAERYGTSYAHMLYQLGLQLVGTGQMRLDLNNPHEYATWLSQTDPDFRVYFSLKEDPATLSHHRLVFGFYPDKATHVFDGTQDGFQRCIAMIRDHEEFVKGVSKECIAQLQSHEKVSTERDV